LHGKLRLIAYVLFFLQASFAVFFVSAGFAQDQQAHVRKNVLVLHGLWRIRTWEIPFNASLHNEFLADKTVTAGITHTYLGLDDSSDKAYHQKIVAELRDKIERNPIDLVISVLPGADSFLLTYGQELFPGVPLVFTLPSTRNIKKLKESKNAFTIPSVAVKALQSSVESIFTVLPDTNHLVVVSGDGPIDRVYLERTKTAIASSKKVTKVSYLVGLPLDELWKRVSSLDADTAILFTIYDKDKNGKKLESTEVGIDLSKKANVPVFGILETLLGKGVVGGNFVSAEVYAKDTAEAALRLLLGEQPAAIPPNRQKSFDVYDWRELKRWNISEDLLPPGSQVQYKTETLWDSYREYIIIGIGVVGLEALLIFALYISLRRSKRSKASLLESEVRYRTLQENVPVGVYRTSAAGKFISLNPAALRMLGFDAAVDLPSLESPDVWSDQEARRDFLNKFDDEGKVTDFVTKFKRKDGSLFWGSLSAAKIEVADGSSYHIDGVIQDFSEQKKAEKTILDYQNRLKALAFQLTVVEEQERRRIAGDLHDHISQSLALTRMQLATAVKSADDAGLKEQLALISQELLMMSDEINHLVFDLSSPTLKKLGLGAAVGEWLDEKINKVSAIDVELIDQLHDVPDELTSLVLFRNIRELLTNSVKYAQASKLVVCLEKEGGAIKVTVKDNGIGFNPDYVLGKSSSNGGFGLFSIGERMADLDGSLTLNSRIHHGTTAIMTVPCKPQAREAN
jgi:PAS domain S-box-containing protein